MESREDGYGNPASELVAELGAVEAQGNEDMLTSMGWQFVGNAVEEWMTQIGRQ